MAHLFGTPEFFPLPTFFSTRYKSWIDGFGLEEYGTDEWFTRAGQGGTLSASWTNEPRVSMFRFDWDSERKKAPCVWSMGGMRFVELKMERMRRKRKREDVGGAHRRFGGRGFVRDCRGIFFFNYTPRDVQKNYRYTLRVVRERLAGYEYTVYQIYERVVNSAFQNVTSTLWSKLSSYIYFLIRNEAEIVRSISLTCLLKHFDRVVRRRMFGKKC